MGRFGRVCVLSFGLAITPALAQPVSVPPPLFNAIFADHAVLQRAKPIHVWGQAAPGSALTVSLAQNTVQTRADESGRWSALLPAMPAGGPYTLAVRTASGAGETVQDVLIGDVWLCSGQSNMAMQVNYALDAYNEIQNASNDSIRLLTIPATGSAVPVESLPANAQWRPVSPATVADFSAACFYFGRELQKTARVPLGLIDAAMGTSRIRTWMSEGALRSVGGFDAPLDILKLYAADPVAAARRWGAMWEAWWKSRVLTEPWRADFDTSGWQTVPSIGYWDQWGVPALVDFTGMVWYRTTVDLTAEQAAQGAVLSLGGIEKVDQVWVNGIPVGGGSGGDRAYPLPAGALHAGTNSVTVNVLNIYGRGGLIGPAAKQALRLVDGNSIALSGPWQYSIVPKSVGDPPRAPWEPVAGLGAAYNGMIAPMASYGIRGAVWYQGESDTDQPDTYKPMLATLMADWRRSFGADLPFLVVQLPGYGPAPTVPTDSNWARLREAQRAAVAGDAHAALAVTIDIGERYNIHPPNKQELGRRLARAARHLIYGEATALGGPFATGARRDKAHVIVSFADVEDVLVAYGADAPIEFQLCGPTQNSCRYASSHIRGNDIVLDVPAKFAPSRVRYAWADDPICTLFDGEGLPAAPFELAIAQSGSRAKER